mmetsp:Transcript_13757/g.26671  ORF Transcript_13757/g.26671 Transcript_13757/m.26671 type:complete len:232 (+) Transcript_13757:1470-2165(+)
MRQSSDGLHFDGVALLKRLVQNTRGIKYLPPQVLVVHVTNVQRLGGKGVRLHLDVGASDLVHETRLTNVRVASDEQRTCAGVDRRQTAEMLADFLEVAQRALVLLHEGGHATESSTLELLATVERVTVLEETGIVAGRGGDETLGNVKLAESELVVVAIVENVAEVTVEGVDVVELGEVVENPAKTLGEGLSSELHLAHVECTDTANGITLVHDGRRLALRLAQDDVQEVI